VRSGREADRNFIVRGWVKEMRHSPWTRHVPNGVYYAAQHELVHRLLSTSRVLVACDPQHLEHVYGCVVASDLGPPRVVHWIYVKGAYRGLGLGRALLVSAFEDEGRLPAQLVCSQASKLFSDAALLERYHVVYSPYLLMGIRLPSPELQPPPGAVETMHD
jgi:GNAT superfamily N-acetyltransferase